MKRYILFDASCMVCTNLAQFIEQESHKVLVARNIQDPEMQAILNEVRPERKWEPAILEINNTHRRLFTGMRMKIYALRILGLHRGLRVLQRVEFEKRRTIAAHPSTLYQSPRRRFLRNVTMLSAVWLGGAQDNVNAKITDSSYPISMTQLLPNDPIILKLRSALASSQATQHFGEFAWDQTYKLSSRTSPQVGYMIPSYSTPSYLFMTSPVAVQPIRAFVIQTRQSINQQSGLAWLTTDGRIIPVDSSQRHSVDTIFTRGAEADAFAPGCFASCAGIAVGLCASPCATCAVVPVPLNPACITCVGCAGGSALFCVVVCS